MSETGETERPSLPTGASWEQRTRKRIVIVGLGMVAMAFIEKMLKLDEKREYEMVVIGEERHVAYNRVGLTSFFEKRSIEELYLNPPSWYDEQKESLNHIINTRVLEVITERKEIITSENQTVKYDILIFATGSDAVLPTSVPGYNAEGVFVYRSIGDLEKLIDYAKTVRGTVGAVVGGGLLGLEAAKAMMDLEDFGTIKLIDRNKHVLSRQLDVDAGMLVVEKIRELGVQYLPNKRVSSIEMDENKRCRKVVFDDGTDIDCTCLCYAIGIKPRDELAKSAGIKTLDRPGGFIVNERLQTNVEDIYAIGECASWEGQTYGLIAPGVEMADVLSYNLTHPDSTSPKQFRRPDLSTKLKLLGVNVASFGDYFADRDGPSHYDFDGTGAVHGRKGKDLVKALSYRDPFQSVYKKYLFTADGKFILGGMMIGDTSDYLKLVGMVKNRKPLEIPPSQLILGAKKEGEEEGLDDIDDDTQVCSCHNVTKKDVADVVKSGKCKSLGEVKSCTKAGTGCAGCIPIVQTIFNHEMKALGQEISNHLCPHFPYSRVDLYNIIAVKKLKTFEEVMNECGKWPNSLGCEVCRPCLASIFSSLFNGHVMDIGLHGLQDTNDKFLGNIQRNGTFSVIPRVAGGEITPENLIVIGEIAKKYGLYCKITGGQRIDMFGAKKQDLVDIWTMLVDAGMESGHAYAKSLRTIKSCVGTSWCRFGVGDSVGMAIQLENRYKSIRAPHKIKSAVSGCIRECAEAQNKDFGLIATDKGYNLFVGGNGGSKPRHSELFVKDCPTEEIIPIIDRYLMFYIRTADKLQRTARWIENLPGGIKYLKQVILEDKLGICKELEEQMNALVGTYFCEWTEVVKDPVKRKKFQQFVNTGEAVEPVEPVEERGQQRPADWPVESAKVDFRGTKWTQLTWEPVVETSHFETATSAAIKRGDTQLAVFKVKGKYYSTQQMCPHKRAFVLSDGLIGEEGDSGEKMWVSCPFHKRNYSLTGKEAGTCSNDSEVNVATFEAKVEDGWVYLKLPPVEELDSVLGTEKWKVRAGEKGPELGSLNLKALKGKKGMKMAEKNGSKAEPIEVVKTAIPVGGGCGGGGLDW